MIAMIAGHVIAKSLDRVEVMTAGGVAYEMAIPLQLVESLPAVGGTVTLHTHLVVKEDGWQLFGFETPADRAIFRIVLGANGVGPALALALLSTLSAERLVRAIRERDVATLQTVPRVGRKKAEQMILDLADKMPADAPSVARTSATDDAVRGLVSLGYARVDADQAVRSAVENGGAGVAAPELIRVALRSLQR
ncbi:MAG TPA: Holliday junction branch migration protein RuvA [Gemmatimonadaceae bacterium]|jgi:Holliday junction DNA helicase RuvA|nr:Holliday junction branch migration protein RuvA [Gemmatimonadaceae bacterium]